MVNIKEVCYNLNRYREELEVNMELVIRKFKVKGFLGRYILEMDFEHNVKVIVAENGFGKTTLLNMLYYTISGDKKELDKLKQYDFEYVELEFGSGKKVHITREEIEREETVTLRKQPASLMRLQRMLTQENFLEVLKQIRDDSISQNMKIYLRNCEINWRVIKSYLDSLDEEIVEQFLNDSLESKIRIIREEMKVSVKPLPTYRRLEIDFPNLYDRRMRRNSSNYELDKIEKELKGLHFGMSDVRERWNEIKRKIEESYRTAFTEISAQILKDISLGKEIQNVKIQDYKPLLQIIDRVDEKYLNEHQKREVKEYLKKHDPEEITSKEYNYFLEKLLQISKGQEEQEEKIYEFKKLCNKYLVNKELVYDAAKLDFYFKETKMYKGEQRIVPIQKLSSGEKQIVALFSMLYLGDEEEYAILFDEPELSLSIEWQQMILEDIYKSNKCKLLIATTHSPFIFDNELDQYAVSLEEYIKDDEG